MYLDPNSIAASEITNTIDKNLEDARKLQVISHLKPSFLKEGNQFCFLYGELPNNCIIGFGDTAYDAMNDFCKNFYWYKAVKL